MVEGSNLNAVDRPQLQLVDPNARSQQLYNTSVSVANCCRHVVVWYSNLCLAVNALWSWYMGTSRVFYNISVLYM